MRVKAPALGPAATFFYNAESARSGDELLEIKQFLASSPPKRELAEWLNKSQIRVPVYDSTCNSLANPDTAFDDDVMDGVRDIMSAHPVVKHVMRTALLGGSDGVNKIEGDPWRFAVA